MVKDPFGVVRESAVEMRGGQRERRGADDVAGWVNPKPPKSLPSGGGESNEHCDAKSLLVQRGSEDLPGHVGFMRGLEFDSNVAGVSRARGARTRPDSFA